MFFFQSSNFYLSIEKLKNNEKNLNDCNFKKLQHLFLARLAEIWKMILRLCIEVIVEPYIIMHKFQFDERRCPMWAP